MSTLHSLLAIIALGAACAGCSRGSAPPEAATDSGAACEKPRSAREPLWKRGGAVTRDLMRALALGEDEVCVELGRHRCADLYKVQLGGSEAALKGIYKAPREPFVTTPLILERMVLHACVRRVDADAAGSPVVFRRLDLTRPALPLSSAELDAEVSADLVELHRRLLSREPTAAEITSLKALVEGEDGEPVSARDFAVLSCFAVGTSTDFLFL